MSKSKKPTHQVVGDGLSKAGETLDTIGKVAGKLAKYATVIPSSTPVIGKYAPTVAKILSGANLTGKKLGQSMQRWGRFIYDRNHPEWYENPLLTGAPAPFIGLNYANDMSTSPFAVSPVEYRGDYNSIGLIAKIPMVLAVNQHASVDKSTLISQLEGMIDVLNAASGRNVGYSAEYLYSYMHNARVITAMISQAVAAFEATFQASYINRKMADNFDAAYNLEGNANLATVRENLRRIVNRFFGSVPVFGDLFDRTIWLFGSVFADTDRPKASYYVPVTFRPAMLFETDSPEEPLRIVEASAKCFSQTDDSPSTWDSMINELDYFVNTFINYYGSQAFKSDVLRVFGIRKSEQILNMFIERLDPTIPSMHIIVDEYMLRQVQNMRTLDSGALGQNNGGTVEITYNTVYDMTLASSVIQEQSIGNQSYILSLSNVALMTTVNASDMDTQRAGITQSITRLCPTFDVITTDNGLVKRVVHSAGTEVPVCIRILTLRQDGIDDLTATQEWIQVTTDNWCFDRNNAGDIPYTEAAEYIFGLNLMSNFDYHPQIITMFINGSGDVRRCSALWDYSEYAVVQKITMDTLHDISTTSLFVPGHVNLLAGSSESTYSSQFASRVTARNK